AEIGLADAGRILQHGLKYRLQLARRTTDYLQHLRCRRLLLERLPQLIEQPRILDGDHGLGGEAGNQGDLLFSERLNTRPPNYNDANDLIFPQHRYGEDGSMHFLLAMMIFSPPIFGVSEDIGNVDHAAL